MLAAVQGRPGFPMPPQGFMPGPVPAAAPQQPPQQVPPPPQPVSIHLWCALRLVLGDCAVEQPPSSQPPWCACRMHSLECVSGNCLLGSTTALIGWQNKIV